MALWQRKRETGDGARSANEGARSRYGEAPDGRTRRAAEGFDGDGGRLERGRRGGRRKGKPDKPHEPGFITRVVNQWASRLLGAVSDKSFHGQAEQYAAHRTSRDYIWNSVAIGAWGMVFPILSIVAAQAVGAERAGMFSMAFVVANLLMIVANFGVRTYQVSDLEERHSFADYQISRVLTCILMMVVGVLYCRIRGYGDEMFLICIGVFIYRMVDGLADVYEGRLQQKDKLYLAGISQAIRSIAVLVVFAVLLFVTRSLVVAGFGMAVVSVLSLAIITIPLAYFETPKSRKPSLGSIIELFKHCTPLFVALFMYTLIDSMPKFVMEGVLSYDNQLYFNALYFPAQFIHLGSQLVYKPMLVRMADAWADTSKRRRFDIVIVAMMLVIVAIAAVILFIMAWIGIPVMSFLYGVDFEQFRGLAYIMLVGGAVMAGIDFLYQTITILRRQRDVMTVYVITFFFSLFIPLLLIEFTGLPGAVLSYLIIMSILFVLLVWVYAKIRIDLARHPEKERPAADDEPAVRERTHFAPQGEAARDGRQPEAAAPDDAEGPLPEVRGVREQEGRAPTREGRRARERDAEERRVAAEARRERAAEARRSGEGTRRLRSDDAARERSAAGRPAAGRADADSAGSGREFADGSAGSRSAGRRLDLPEIEGEPVASARASRQLDGQPRYGMRASGGSARAGRPGDERGRGRDRNRDR